jgi:hypothetical protein
MTSILEALPVELVAEVLATINLECLVKVCYLSRRLYRICADPQINPWRRPIIQALNETTYPPSLKNLSVRTVVPRQNWIEILSLARSPFLLFEATLPSLSDTEWRECFMRRFLPGLQRWKHSSSWREVFMK